MNLDGGIWTGRAKEDGQPSFAANENRALEVNARRRLQSAPAARFPPQFRGGGPSTNRRSAQAHGVADGVLAYGCAGTAVERLRNYSPWGYSPSPSGSFEVVRPIQFGLSESSRANTGCSFRTMST